MSVFSGNKITFINPSMFHVISDFRREVDENCALQGYYTASSSNLLPTFRDNLSGTIFKDQRFLILKYGTW
jgi:hypothetical protein